MCVLNIYIYVIYGILKLQKIACPRSYTLKPEMNPLRPLFPAVSARFERPTCQASRHPHLGDFGVLTRKSLKIHHEIMAFHGMPGDFGAARWWCDP